METLFLVSIRMKGPGRGHLWPAQVQLEPRSTEPPEPPLRQAGLAHTYLIPAAARCVGVAVCPGSSSSPRFRACVPPPLPTAKLQVQFLKRFLDVEGIPADPEHEAESKDQGPRVDQEVPVIEGGEDAQQQKDQTRRVEQEGQGKKERAAPRVASSPPPPQEHCPGAAGGAQLRSGG